MTGDSLTSERASRLLAVAESLVRVALDTPDATLDAPALLRDRTRSVVARVRVVGVPGVSSLIVKAAAAGDATFYDEWASLAFLTALPGAGGVAPRFVAGSAAERLLVLEDLGGSRSLDDVLREPRRTPVLHALAALGRTTARLHAATSGSGVSAHERRFDALRAALPGGRAHDRVAAAASWVAETETTLDGWRDALGVAAPQGAEVALGAVAAAYRDPGPWLAFTHGDPAPSNNHVAPNDDDGTVRLLDFEYGGFRHALYDPTAWAVLCPLPADALAALRDAYRAALAMHAPSLASGDAFDAAWAAMACWRAVAMLGWLRATTVAANAPWVDGWTRREAAIAACERMADAVALGGDPNLAALGTLGAALAAAMRARWPEYGPASDGSVLPKWTALAAPDRPH
ncbi:MAG TPA: hypothetical protein VFJ74_17990 [Gemmatimonadaceae bacterium]|nr:hypothetical protein [Gemmatimonadaceae bacterium]